MLPRLGVELSLWTCGQHGDDMAEINPAGFFQGLSTHTAEQFRSYLGSLLTLPSAAASLKTASGIHPALGGQLAVTQNGTPNMTVNIAAGFAFIAGTEGTKQGTYFCENDATVNKSITASDPTNPRIDIVVAKIQDAFYSGATNAWSLAVVTGTPAGSPSAPAAPANSVTLAQIAVAANATTIVTGNITDKRPFMAAVGGSILCTSIVRPANPYEGLYGFETDTNAPIYYDGTRWFRMGRQVTTAAGRAAFTGQITGMDVYETDTGLFYYWNGAKWIRLEQRLMVSPQFTSTGVGFADIGGLTFTGDANSVYIIDGWFHTVAPTAGDLSLQWSLPAGASIEWTALSPASTDAGTTVVTTIYQGAITTAGTLTVGGMNSTGTTATIKGTITIAGTAGTCKMQGAQASASGTSFVRTSSWLKVTQVS